MDDAALEVAEAVVDQQPAPPALRDELREHALHRRARHAHPEVVAGHLLDHVGLVEDDDVVVEGEVEIR